jgi:hypothetical protein
VINNLNENAKKFAGWGLLLIIAGIIGITAANSYNYTSSNECLLSISAIVGFLGILALCPLLIKFAVIAIKILWKLLKRAIYELFYTATKAIVDAKKYGYQK